MWQALIGPAMQSLTAENQAQEAAQRQQLAGLYAQQQPSPLQRFATQNPQIDPAMFGDLFLRKKKQQEAQPMVMTEQQRPYSGQPTQLEYLA